MRKNNGFVFMETIVVVSVLSLTLLLLFSSYSYILRKARERNTFDTTETIYKTFYTKKIIDKAYPGGLGVKRYVSSYTSPECKQMGTNSSYVCDYTDPDYSGTLHQVVKAFEVEKIYLVNPHELFTASNSDDWLYMFDATTIDYLHNVGSSINYDLFIVKYKKQYNKDDGSYEVIHSSMEAK